MPTDWRAKRRQWTGDGRHRVGTIAIVRLGAGATVALLVTFLAGPVVAAPPAPEPVASPRVPRANDAAASIAASAASSCAS